MTDQRERVSLLSTRLLSSEAARRKAVVAGNMKLHNDLASMNRETIGETPEHDLRSLVTRWMLERARDAEVLAETQAALERCREALRLAAEVTS